MKTRDHEGAQVKYPLAKFAHDCIANGRVIDAIRTQVNYPLTKFAYDSIANGRFIDAIKELRRVYPISLKDAKDIVDHYRTVGLPAVFVPPAPPLVKFRVAFESGVVVVARGNGLSAENKLTGTPENQYIDYKRVVAIIPEGD